MNENNFAHEVTIIIKTFHRKYVLLKLLKSINTYLPNTRIIILDDGYLKSRINLNKLSKLYIRVIRDQIDVGLSKGRNILLSEVYTPYFFLMDDDYLLTNESNLDKSLTILKNSPFDIIGGLLVDKHELNSLISIMSYIKRKFTIKSKEIKPFYLKNYSFIENLWKSQTVDYDTTMGLIKVSSIPNFFIAKTARIKEIDGWQPDYLKLHEHGLFFLRCHINEIKVGFTDSFKATHLRYTPLIYRIFRSRSNKKLLDLAYSKMGIRF